MTTVEIIVLTTYLIGAIFVVIGGAMLSWAEYEDHQRKWILFKDLLITLVACITYPLWLFVYSIYSFFYGDIK